MVKNIDDILQQVWGYDSFRPLQREIIESVLAGHDTLGLLPTGGGKSLTFQVPALALDGLTIVITPLISLMKDQVDNLRQRGVRAYCLHSGLTRSEARLAMDRCRLGKTRLLYVSPEKLQSESFAEELRTWAVSLIVVDEAHCISQWGYDFRPSYLKIQALRDFFLNAPVLALTASATPEVAADIMKQLRFRDGCKQFAKSFHRDNLSYIVRYDEYKERTLVRVLQGVAGTAIVYVRSRRRCREIAEMLCQHGISADYYHAGLAPEEKEGRQNAWKTDQVRVMVATNAFGMGIDKPDVRVVAHMDLPASLEEYYQEAGRAGRDGEPAYAVVIASKADKAMLSRRVSDAFPPKDYIAHVYEMAGNFLDVAVGSGYDQVFEFNFPLFCQRFHLQPIMTDSALKLLSRAQYIDYIDELHTRSRVMIIAQKQELYGLKLDDATDRVFCELQRMYTGLFADYTYIREIAISLQAGVSEEQVYQSLLTLSRMHVLSYIPKKATPYLYYATSREEPKYILLPKVVYEDRRERMAERVEAMKQFVYGQDGCRVQRMLRYFGEKDAKECGTCDWCREQKKKVLTHEDENQIRNSLQYLMSRPEGCSIAEALATIRAPREEIIEAYRQLADEGYPK